MSNKQLMINWDLDNTLLNSTKEIVRQFNNKYNQSNDWTKTRMWNFTDSCEGITVDDINEMFGSKEFFDNVEFTELMRIYLRLMDTEFVNAETYDSVDINFGISSKGNPNNLYHKEKFVERKIPHDRLILECDSTMDKSSLSGDWMHIDDNQKCLLTCGCKRKVLYAPYGKCEWNQDVYDLPSEETGIDIVSNAKELYQYILYALRKENVIKYVK